MEPRQQLEKWQGQVADADEDAAADMDVAKRLLKHGIEALDKIGRLKSLSDEALDLLATIFDAYEEGPDCYEDPDDCSGHLGKAVNLDDTAFDRIADILNKHRPRNSVVTPNADVTGLAPGKDNK